jgi:hypothetical protein
MIKLSVFYPEAQDVIESITSILQYARQNRLYVWQVTTENDAQFTEYNRPTQFALHAWLVTDKELGHLNHEVDLSKDDIPF